ncbi:MAG: DNA repair protein RecO [Bacteroidales bacterium]|nr:MAG: DNA repair protein RecO [Bacteroidales bacterium]
MIHKTRAIALHTIRYGDNSLIAYVYSESHGRLSMMVHSAYGKQKSSGKAVFFQPLSIINLVYYHRGQQTLCKLKEVSSDVIYSTIPFDPVKRAIALFIGEVIYRTIREEESNPAMFNFLVNSIQLLDVMHSGVSNFHLIFLAQLTRYLGFFPGNQWNDSTPVFDYKNGLFVHATPSHPLYFNEEKSKLFGLILSTPFHDIEIIKLNHKARAQVVENFLRFYQMHFESVSGIKSLPILSQIFEN